MLHVTDELPISYTQRVDAQYCLKAGDHYAEQTSYPHEIFSSLAHLHLDRTQLGRNMLQREVDDCFEMVAW